MTTLTATPRRKQARFCRLVRQGAGWLLTIRTVRPRAGDQIDTYTVSEFSSDLGRGFRLVKADGTVYSACLGATAADTVCDCKGNASHGHCKHVEALGQLATTGRLAKPEPEPYAGCVHCHGTGYRRCEFSVTRCNCHGF